MQGDLYQRYAKIPTAVISDVLRAAGAPHQVLHHGIASVGFPVPFAAPAFCVKGEKVLGTLKPSDDQRFEMYRRFPHGAALVLASGGYTGAVVFGENVALSLKVKGCVAILTDGGIRDKDALVEMEMPVYASFVTPLSGGKQWITTALDTPVAIPGESCSTIMIESGDVIVGDNDGIVVVPKRGALSILEDAEQVIATEGRTRDRILRGDDPEEVYASEPRFKKVRAI